MKKFAFMALALLLSCGSPHRYYPCEDPCPPEPFEVPEKIRIALVLGSGGVKGMAHVGVLEELDRAGIKVDIVVGSSAGALVGAFYCDNPCIADLKDVVSKIRTSNILDINLWTCRYGLSQGQFLRRMLNRHLNAVYFDELQIPLVVVATDLFSAELVPIGAGEIIPALQASSSIPFVFSPVVWRDRILVDGGVVNPLPVCIARDLGADLIIAVDLCELLTQNIPTNLFGVAKRSAEIAFVWQNSGCLTKDTLVIKPKMYQVGMFNDAMKEELYQAGRTACLEMLPRIQEAISRLEEARDEAGSCKPKKLVFLPCYKP